MKRALLFLAFMLLAMQANLQSAECPDALLNKKVAVIIGTKSPSIGNEMLQQIVSYVEDILMEYGFVTIDQNKLKELIPEEQKKLILMGDTVGAIKLSDELGADLFLLGNVSLRKKKIPGYSTGIHSVFLTISMKLMEAHSAKIIATGMLSKKSAGVDTLETVIKILDKGLKPAMHRIYKQYCRKGEAVLAPQNGATPPEISSEQAEQLPSAGNNASPPPKSSLEDL